jgi:histidyl-tRNA synthetase
MEDTKMIIQAPKGTKDMLPADAYKWQYLEKRLREIAATYGFREIRTPIFEHTELFLRGIGETTDVVQKEMYTFNDKGNRSITLKPEGTAPAVRAYVESSLYNEVQPTKMYYFTPVFRYENVQKGRLRQHHQFGVEAFGAQDASIDAEIISLAMRVFRELGITSIELNINNIGCPKCRKTYNEALQAYLKANYDNLCETCKTRFEKNPMRILDCKELSCKKIVAGAPMILDYLCDECEDHFGDLKKYLDALGIAYKVDPLIVRGLDYYSKTVFEIINDGITVCGGGRYDYLIEQIDGPSTPAMGFGMGMERLILTMEQNNITIPVEPFIDLYVGSMGDAAKLKSMQLVNSLRQKGMKCESDHMDRSVKAEMKYANKIGARYTLVIGEDELSTGKAKLKRMSDGELFDCDINDIESIELL